ncbi:MAG: glutamine--fructose-6-phosphate transaminase (isomerizing) [Candidatus Marinimicrobia bacterium]|nr:glutamine--fructose-6-phosphate transaminase (isomerizing) [Candidatus Neomarinimicrobiota bacterium]|tara:strand:- start:194 stop:2032 length:1839 start_codon:yes stop_codon:yes gene_type:complete
MCGIVGYFGNKDSVPILINGLKRLEYRGYDSAGLAVIGDDQLHLLKKAGKVSVLESEVDDHVLNGTVGIAHTRWATHGEPNDINAHPHTDQDGKIALIHNGIIENYNVLKQVLEKEGVKFQSETDSEVLVQLISKIYYTDGLSFPEAVQAALQEVVGAYGIVAICKDEPEIMVAARYGSPLVLGVGEGEYFVASDASPIIEHTRSVIYLDEGEMVVLKNDGYIISQIKDKKVVYKDISIIEHDLEAIEKGNFPHFMLKEIHDQVDSITDTMRGRLQVDKGYAFLGGLSDYMTRIENAKRFYITACGTSWHAGLIGKYLLEEYAGIPVYVEYASEFRYRRTIIDNETVVIAISQSGETADTLAAIKKAKEQGSLTLGICNVVGSSITRITDCGVYTHAGPEIGVASTKAFTAQVTVLSMLALLLGRKKGMSKQQGIKLATALANVGKDVKTILSDTEVIENIAWEYEKVDNFLYLGRGVNFPVALEGALKLKEISYIHAEGYPAAEMKHGPIALIDEKMPVLFIVPHDQTYQKVLSNIQEVQARKGRIIILTDKKSKELEKLSDHIIEIPQSHSRVFPILATIPLQLLAYHLAVIRGGDVDMPRNLAKSVTVE